MLVNAGILVMGVYVTFGVVHLTHKLIKDFRGSRTNKLELLYKISKFDDKRVPTITQIPVRKQTPKCVILPTDSRSSALRKKHGPQQSTSLVK
jgi:hypothetical protein